MSTFKIGQHVAISIPDVRFHHEYVEDEIREFVYCPHFSAVHSPYDGKTGIVHSTRAPHALENNTDEIQYMIALDSPVRITHSGMLIWIIGVPTENIRALTIHNMASDGISCGSVRR